jgi:hypothetical protein
MTSRHACIFSLALLGLVACGDAGRSEANTPSAKAASGADAATAAAATAPVPSVTRIFGNWTAVCNNANDCWAYATAEDFGSGWVLLNYPAGPAGQVEVRVGDWSDTPGPLRLSIDGQAIGAAATQRSEGGDGAMIDRFDDLPDFIARLGQGRTLAVQSADPDSAPSISLQGAAAAFLWIDERQGRLGTTTALARRGDRRADSVPTAPALPIVGAAPAVSQAGLSDDPILPAGLEALAQVKACRADMDWGNGAGVQKNDNVARLDGDTLLWSVLCFRGAYNEGHRFFLTGNEGQNPRPVLFRSTDQEGEDAGQDDDYILINAGYDPETRTVFSFSKGRGLGDCGAAYVWTWTGREFTLTEERVMQKCAGLWPDLWPTTWRSREG